MIYTIGETVLDIIFKNNIPVAAKAGGSMLNSVVSLGRGRQSVAFISEYGTDDAGCLIDSFLKENGVNTQHVFRYDNGKTVVSLAFLNEKNDARYSFYKQYPPERLDKELPVLQKDDILLFGSFYSIWSEIRPRFKAFVAKARDNGAILIYDPNFRRAHLHELEEMKPMIFENMGMATIVRGSDEDFKFIFGAETPEEAYAHVSKYCPNLVYTANAHGVFVRTTYVNAHFPVKPLIPVSTIGAGDSFNAGMIYALSLLQISRTIVDRLDETNWKKIAGAGVAFASEVCMSYDNYISKEFANKL